MRDYFMDSVSIRSFHAFHKGNFVSTSGRNGHFPSSVANVAPLTIIVAANSMEGLLHSFIYLARKFKDHKGYIQYMQFKQKTES